MTKDVNPNKALLPQLLEAAMRRWRTGVLELSEARFPGLRSRHYRLLSFVTDDGVRLSQVAVASGLTKQALAQTLVPLEAGGYAEVIPDPTDRRARLVRRTARGREVIAAIHLLQDSFEREWAERVGPHRWATTREVLTDLFTR